MRYTKPYISFFSIIPYSAKVVGVFVIQDHSNDDAVAALPVISFAREPVIAIGSPLELKYTG